VTAWFTQNATNYEEPSGTIGIEVNLAEVRADSVTSDVIVKVILTLFLSFKQTITHEYCVLLRCMDSVVLYRDFTVPY